MFIKLLYVLKWLFIFFILISVITTIITLIFNDFKPNEMYMGKKRPPINRSVKTHLDEVVEPYLLAHPNGTGLYLLDDNLEAYADRILLVRGAERTLDLQYYIWHDDLTGNMLGRELLAAADRGVFIRILLDDMNTVRKDVVLSGLAQHPYVEIRLFNPVHSRRNFITRTVEMLFRGLSLNRRMHNKSMIADGQIAIIGGRNIGNEYFDADPETNFLDVDLLLVGKAVKEAEDIFESFWDSQASIPAKQVKFGHKDALTVLRETSLTMSDTESQLLKDYQQSLSTHLSIDDVVGKQSRFVWSDRAHVLSDPPEKVFGQQEAQWLITDVLPKAWAKTEQSLYLISPYFVPGEEGTKTIIQLSQSGRDVMILTNSLAANDVPMVHAGYAPYREALLKSGVKLYELMPFNVNYKLSKDWKIGASGASLHTKAFIIDNAKGFIGSFNLDPRSARLNTEMGVFFESPEIAMQLMQRYQKIITRDTSYEVVLKDNKMIWLDDRRDETKEWDTDPETGWIKRAIVKIVSWLPIESQL
ncbi:phospholipase D family protein [Wohlfahrtiimonas larvae]|uniref:Phospholipase D family protein n=1 Tax=Wohlfahrtiimonas larvae TaxID=1157986 RepID=A0ABP9N308_9GAMM|nr:phospholipase D family protein [Wohlfahrtiimonas larvae]